MRVESRGLRVFSRGALRVSCPRVFGQQVVE